MCPFYLLCGMTYEQYWYASPYLVKTYRQLHKLKIRQKNEEMWMQGLYNFNAVGIALSNLNFDGKKRPFNRYLEKPFDLEEKSEREKKKDAEMERDKIVKNLKAWKQAMEKKAWQ